VKRRKIIYRVDGGVRLGMGHLKRAVVLAEELGDEFEMRFYVREDDTGFGYLRKAGLETVRIQSGLGEKEGAAMTTRENVHRMAEANKAFAHFAW